MNTESHLVVRHGVKRAGIGTHFLEGERLLKPDTSAADLKALHKQLHEEEETDHPYEQGD